MTTSTSPFRGANTRPCSASKDKKYTALGIYYDNKSSNDTNFKGLSMSIDELEKKVGVDFFVNLPDDVEKAVEAAKPADESWWWNN